MWGVESIQIINKHFESVLVYCGNFLVHKSGQVAVRALTVGDRIFETLVFFNFSAQDASILKISVPIRKKRF